MVTSGYGWFGWVRVNTGGKPLGKGGYEWLPGLRGAGTGIKSF